MVDDVDPMNALNGGLRATYVIETYNYYVITTTDDNDDDDDIKSKGGMVGDGQRNEVDYGDYATQRERMAAVPIRIEKAACTIGGRIVTNDYDMTGVMIWPATHLACQYLISSSCRAAGPGTRGIIGGTVLELGCGCGMVGIAAAVAAASRRPKSSSSSFTCSRAPPSLWISTDMHDSVLELCRKNYRLNGIDVDCDDDQAYHSAHVRQLLWGDHERMDEILTECQRRVENRCNKYRMPSPSSCAFRFDAVVGADIVYPDTCGKVLDDLFETVDRMLSADGTFYLSYASRDGSRTSSRLVDAAGRSGYRVSCILSAGALDPDLLLKRLPPMLDSKLLALRRAPNAREENDRIGIDDRCPIFPGMRNAAAREEQQRQQVRSSESTKSSSIDGDDETQWDAPFACESIDL